ncbi:DUF2750 domain-containing protein [Thalassolituus sp.]|jgi:hypothetical protein|uniref:DUF2750 domain-containing protein n=1 Tax=Thalassolituus sp. TaxID=2030822 RepID=UPI00262CBE96|nr:DUF2750 domain-containing protein [uncultured Thalassolituus sp.]
MPYALSAKNRESSLALSDNKRYELFLSKVAEFGEVWSLANEEGWVTVVTDEGENCLPVWPHPDYALDWATGDWADCEPKMIPLDVWLERWTPGLDQDETLLVVFPNLKEQAVLVDPFQLDEDIRAILEQED